MSDPKKDLDFTREFKVSDQSEKPVTVAIDVTSERVNYHQDTVDYLLTAELVRCASEGIELTATEVNDFKRQLVKTLIIRHDAEGAVNLRIK